MPPPPDRTSGVRAPLLGETIVAVIVGGEGQTIKGTR